MLTVTTPNDDRTQLMCTAGSAPVHIAWETTDAAAVAIAPGDLSDASAAPAKVTKGPTGDATFSIPCQPSVVTVTATGPGGTTTVKVRWASIMAM